MAAMRAKTEELLYMLLWASEMLWHPTFRNFTESFECQRSLKLTHPGSK
jgi:hypothetical protein